MFDLSVYGILDPAQIGAHDPVQIAGLAARGGMTMVQVRDKTGPVRNIVRTVRRLRTLPSDLQRPVIVNDRADVAHAAGADGVHVGQDDLAPAAARAILGPDAIIGVTVRTDEEAHETDLEPVDYVGLGGVFATTSKVNETEPIGLDGVARIGAILRRRKPGLPIVAIAGIDVSNAAAVVGAGADGVAVLSALFSASDPEAAARNLKAAVGSAKTEVSQ